MGIQGLVDGKPINPKLIITKEKAEQLLNLDVEKFEKAVISLVKVPIKQNQFDALISFCYNVGIGNFQSSTLLKLLNEKNTPLLENNLDVGFMWIKKFRKVW